MTQKIDYGKIIYVGVPLAFMFWAVSIIGLAVVFGGSKSTALWSALLTLAFVISYFILSVKNAKKVGAIIVEPELNQPMANAKKPISNAQAIYGGIFIVCMIASLATVVLVYDVPPDKAFLFLAPFFGLVVVAERIYIGIRAKGRSSEADR